MLIQIRSFIVEPGHGDQLVERFSSQGLVDKMKGFIDRTVMVNRRAKEQEEVVILIRWESADDWKNWEKSPEHIAGHREKRGKEQPSFIISSSVQMYDVKAHLPGQYTEE